MADIEIAPIIDAVLVTTGPTDVVSIVSAGPPSPPIVEGTIRSVTEQFNLYVNGG
jgi:hypothetical protein